MKGNLKTLILILVALAILIPLASNSPDGLEKVAETLQIEEGEPLWKGLMEDYTLPNVENPYLSTLIAGIIGVLLVLAAAYLAGLAITRKDKQQPQSPTEPKKI
ncbi:MAG: PDGLE domain-containing protein [Candidatus Bathyarchaeota archaeon]|nr:PDGLE domain-containing protein [Candidatus Bathyarchaeota archaeon]